MPGDLISHQLPGSGEYASRLYFLHEVIKDTQDTVRFLDTKAAFCVTLLSGMTAVVLQYAPRANGRILVSLFLVAAVASVLTCMRVIFPTFLPRAGNASIPGVKFYIGPRNGRRWIVHTFTNPHESIVVDTPGSYGDSVMAATDADLLKSLAATAYAVASIRQLKSDRLHAAMICMTAAVLLFAVRMLI
jgi:hypothetical protein